VKAGEIKRKKAREGGRKQEIKGRGPEKKEESRG
jgi:hypothetical protein